MGQIVLLDDMIAKVRLAADQQGTTLRVTDDDITILIRDAFTRYVGIGSGAGWSYWLSHHTSTFNVGRATDGVTTDYPFGTALVDASTGTIEGIYRFEMRLPSGEWVDLEPIEFSQANWHQSVTSPMTNGVPQQYWVHGGADTSSGEGNTTWTVGFTPPADSAYIYRAWYALVPYVSTLSPSIDVGPVGGEWWMIWDVVGTLALRDHLYENVQAAAAKQQQAWAELVSRVAGRNKDRSFRVQDTKGQRRERMSRYWGR